MNKGIKIFIGIVLFLAILYILPVLLIRDEKPLGDGKMSFDFDIKSIPESQNGYIISSKDKIISASLDEIEKEINPISTKELVDGLITKDQKYIDIVIKQIAKDPNFFSVISEIFSRPYYKELNVKRPQEASAYDILDPKGIARLSKAVPIAIAYQFAINNETQAQNLIVQSLAFTNKCYSSHYALVNYLACTAYEQSILDTVNKIAIKSALSGSDILSFRNYINAYMIDSRYAVNALKGEYFFERNIIMSFYSSYKNKQIWEKSDATMGEKLLVQMFPFTFLPNTTVNKAISLNENALAEVERGYCDKGTIDKENDIMRAHKQTQSLINIVGNEAFAVVAVGATDIAHKECERKFSEVGMDLNLAIQAYRKDNGVMPSSLDSLIPKYISSIPSDPFGNSSLKYSATKGIMYSIGSDFADDSGDSKKDLVIKVK